MNGDLSRWSFDLLVFYKWFWLRCKGRFFFLSLEATELKKFEHIFFCRSLGWCECAFFNVFILHEKGRSMSCLLGESSCLPSVLMSKWNGQFFVRALLNGLLRTRLRLVHGKWGTFADWICCCTFSTENAAKMIITKKFNFHFKIFAEMTFFNQL